MQALGVRGHRITTPTQTGLGERTHLLSPQVDLAVFIDDIVNHLAYGDLTDVILVGHSFGGAVITGVTDPTDAAMLRAKLAPHPLATYTSALRLDHPAGTSMPTDYIMCTEPLYAPLAASRERARAKRWPIHTIAAAHDAMITRPAAIADLLDSFG